MISVLLPSRGRPDKLEKSVRSLLDAADRPEKVEIIVRADDDDLDTISAAARLSRTHVLSGPRHGYQRLHYYVNECAAHAVGDWFFLWNDDSYMKTQGWDSEVYAWDDGTFKVLNPRTNHNAPELAIFPIIPRRMYEILGHFSFSNHNDTWVQVVAQHLGALQEVNIDVFHDRFDLTGEEPDETARQSMANYRSQEFFSPRMQKFIRRDADMVKANWVDYDFEDQREEWVKVPIDDIGYFSVRELLGVSDDELNDVVQRMWKIRYARGGWRNFEEGWVRGLNLDEGGRRVLDFGCGIGLDGLRMAKAGNEVVLADVNEESVEVAERVFGLYGLKPAGKHVIERSWPYVPDMDIDEFYASGVLHHTPNAPNIVRRMAEITPIMRLMLYSEGAWHMYSDGGSREKFTRAMDAVGNYADYYSPWIIEERFGRWADVLDVEYITDNLRYLVATLKARG